MKVEVEWVPHTVKPEYTTHFRGTRFVSLLLADSDGGIWPGEYEEGRFCVFGVEHQRIKYWAYYPKHPEE